MVLLKQVLLNFILKYFVDHDSNFYSKLNRMSVGKCEDVQRDGTISC